MKNSGKNLLDYWIAIYKKKRAIYIIIIASILTSLILSKLLDPIYEAKASFIVLDTKKTVSFMAGKGLEDVARSFDLPTTKQDPLECFVEIMKSREFSKRVAKNIPNHKWEKIMRNVSFVINSSIIEIYARDYDRNVSAQIANTFMELFNNFLQEDSSQNLTTTISLLENRLAHFKTNLETAQDEMRSFEEINNIASLDDEIKNLVSLESSFKSKLEDANVQIDSTKQKINSTVKQLKKEGQLYRTNKFIATNKTIEDLQLKLYDLSSKIAYASVELTEKHPEINSLIKQYKELEIRLKNEVKKLVNSQIKPSDVFHEKLRQDLVNNLIEQNTLYASGTAYKDVLHRFEKRKQEIPDLKVKKNRLSDRVERLRKMYEQIYLDLEESRTQRNRKVQIVSVVNWADPPDDEAFPLLFLNIPVAFLTSIVFGIFYALFLDYIETSRKIRLRKIAKTILQEE